MVAAFQIDTLAYAKKLKNAGADERLAEAIVEGLTNADTSTLATKEDLRELRHELKNETAEIKVELRWVKGIGGAILLLNAYPILAKLLS
jgi:hypothetical protein